MAKTPMYDPLSTEARSPWLAGLTEACSKLSNILDLETDTFSDLALLPVDDNYIIYQAPLGNKLWLDTPAPVVRKNGIVITPMNDHFTINYLGGSVEFDKDAALTKNDTITADATFIVDTSNTLSDIFDKLNAISTTSGQFKGYFPDVITMEAALGNGVAGNYVLIGGTENTFYVWNPTAQSWEKSYKETDLSDYYTRQDTDNLLDGKEDLIVEHGTTPSDDDYYYGGRKEWVNINDKVSSIPLTGLDTTDDSKVDSSDSIFDAIGKLQAQINQSENGLEGLGDPTISTVGEIGQDYTNTSTGEKYHLTEIVGTDYIWVKYQDELEFDSSPTAGSNNILTSGTIYDALSQKADSDDVANIIANDLAQKADKAVPSSVGNIAILSADGNLVDSGKGVNDVGKSPTQEIVTLSSSNWIGGSAPYSQTVNVTGILSDPTKQNIIISPYPSVDNINATSAAHVYCTGQGNGTLTFSAMKSIPTTQVLFNVSIQNL